MSPSTTRDETIILAKVPRAREEEEEEEEAEVGEESDAIALFFALMMKLAEAWAVKTRLTAKPKLMARDPRSMVLKNWRTKTNSRAFRWHNINHHTWE